MKRGDLDKMSFAFVPTRQSWDDEEDMPRRTIESAELYDVSVVTTPHTLAPRSGCVRWSGIAKRNVRAKQPDGYA
jgi:HK97 family phage prohead protease